MRLNLCFLLLAGMCLLTLVTGCGQSVYDARMQQALAANQKRMATTSSKDERDLAPDYTSITNSANVPQGIKFKLPKLFATNKTQKAELDSTGKFVFAGIPGHCFTLKTIVTEDDKVAAAAGGEIDAREKGKEVSAYCYVYSIKKSEMPKAQVEDAIKKTLAEYQLQTEPLKTGNLPFTRIWTTVANNFEVEVAGKLQVYPSTLSLYTFETDENTIVVGWMVSGNSELSFAKERAMNSAVLDKPAAPAPAPMS